MRRGRRVKGKEGADRVKQDCLLIYGRADHPRMRLSG